MNRGSISEMLVFDKTIWKVYVVLVRMDASATFMAKMGIYYRLEVSEIFLAATSLYSQSSATPL